MFCKRLGLILLLWGLFVIPLPAAMVSFLIIEDGLKPDAQSGHYSAVWEDSLMGVFFDAGHIVSNSPVLRVEQLSVTEFPAEARVDYTDASSGGADFFVLAVLDFNTEDRRTRPKSVTIKIFTTESRNLIFQQEFPAGNGVNAQDEYSRAQDIGRYIAAQLRDR